MSVLRKLEQHEASQSGRPFNHCLFRDMLLGFAGAEVDKLLASHGLRNKMNADQLKEEARACPIGMFTVYISLIGSSN
ncbi:hypothetical protein BJ742DRAFT_853595 [Cladochytrium replicatum]|nr:hypothetical protein BJ742DRAFT_853595 [Cladochytrium replicatum]